MRKFIIVLSALLLTLAMFGAAPAVAEPGHGWQQSEAKSQGDSQGKGCPFIGVSWSWWATASAHGEWEPAVGEWTAEAATEGSVPDGYEKEIGVDEGTIGDGPGVYSRVLATYCEHEPGS